MPPAPATTTAARRPRGAARAGGRGPEARPCEARDRRRRARVSARARERRQPPAVARPGELARALESRARPARAPERRPGVHVHGLEPAALARVDEHVAGVRPPRRCHRRGVAAKRGVARAVASHRPQHVALEIRHEEAVAGAPGRMVHPSGARDRPLLRSGRVHRHHPVTVDSHHVQARAGTSRRRRRSRAGASPRHGRRRRRSARSRARTRPRAGPRRRAVPGRPVGEAIPDPVAHLGAGGRERRHEAHAQGRRHEREPEREPPWPARPPCGRCSASAASTTGQLRAAASASPGSGCSRMRSRTVTAPAPHRAGRARGAGAS